MSYKRGRNNERNRANRGKTAPATAIGDGAKPGSVVVSRTGQKYRIGPRGNLIRINP